MSSDIKANFFNTVHHSGCIQGNYEAMPYHATIRISNCKQYSEYNQWQLDLGHGQHTENIHYLLHF